MTPLLDPVKNKASSAAGLAAGPVAGAAAATTAGAAAGAAGPAAATAAAGLQVVISFFHLFKSCWLLLAAASWQLAAAAALTATAAAGLAAAFLAATLESFPRPVFLVVHNLSVLTRSPLPSAGVGGFMYPLFHFGLNCQCFWVLSHVSLDIVVLYIWACLFLMRAVFSKGRKFDLRESYPRIIPRIIPPESYPRNLRIIPLKNQDYECFFLGSFGIALASLVIMDLTN